MIWGGRVALAAAFLAGAMSLCLAQEVKPAAASPSFDDVVGKKLIAIDGSTISLSPAEGGLTRDIVSANGNVQKTFLLFINDKLGTVADATDLRKVVGVFRRMEGGIEIEYADGSTETLAVNPGGGITAETISAAATACVAWYPQGHQFSLDERKAALAAFASRLGLSDPSLDGAKSSCGHEAKPADLPKSADVEPKPAIPAPPTSVPRPLLAGTGAAAITAPLKAADVAAAAASTAPLKTADVAAAAAGIAPLKEADVAAAAQAIEVRKSEVHSIDPMPAADLQKPQVLASANPPDPIAPDRHGASSCLSVESDGMHWGFRNHCGYSVQFAYCLMTGSALASCKDGAIAGSVAGNGFGALVADESLKETDAEHDFRWVACQGGAGEVIPRLDQINPPVGRCVQ